MPLFTCYFIVKRSLRRSDIYVPFSRRKFRTFKLFSLSSFMLMDLPIHIFLATRYRVFQIWKKRIARKYECSSYISRFYAKGLTVGMCGSLNWELKFNYFPWIELNWLNCCDLKVSFQFINIFIGNKIAVKYHKFLCFQIWHNLDDVKLVFAIQKLKILNQTYCRKLQRES